MKKGFTLIELLAVIVILAIIALIATPIILGIIEDARDNAKIRSAKFYIDAVEQAIVRYKMTEDTSFSPTRCEISNGNLYCDGSDIPLQVDVDGEKPKDGTIIVLSNGIVSKTSEIVIKFEGAIIKFDDKEQLILSKPICTLESGTEYAVGSKYTCNPGDGNKTFYIVESSENPVSGSTLSEGEFALILSQNIDNTTMSWCNINLSSLCTNGGSRELFDDKTSRWTNDQIIKIQLPASNQVSADFNDTTTGVAEWLKGFYWLSDSWFDEADSKSWGFVANGSTFLDVYLEDNGYGLRPVIIVSKINLN